MQRSRWLACGFGAVLVLLAFGLKWPLLDTSPYGDENLHFVLAADPRDPTPNYQDVWGNPFGVSTATFWQRPVFYLAFHGPAMVGFDAFRAAQALVASLLAPLGAALVRAHGASRFAAASTGLVLAIDPAFVLWGAYAFMDVLMMVALFGFLLARHAGRWRLSAVLAVVAVWTKETAYAAVIVLFVIDLVRALRAGRATLYPLRLQSREASLAWPIVLGPLPLVWAIAQGLTPPGSPAYGTTADIANLLLPTIWMLPLLCAGLLWTRSRFLCAAALAAFAAFLLLHAAGRTVEAWYAIPSMAFAIAGGAIAADALIHTARTRRWGTRTVAALPAVLAFVACVSYAVLPAGAARDLLYPLGEPRANLADTYAFEAERRSADLDAALAEIPLDQHVDVLLEQDAWPLPYVQLEEARTVYVDKPGLRSFIGFSVGALAARIENATTWTVLGTEGQPMQLAIADVYEDCLVATHGAWRVYYGAPCAGRGDQLRLANHERGGP